MDITNLGDQVNSPYPDYFPFVPKDESYILFNSRRVGGDALPNGSYPSDIYLSEVKDGKFGKAKKIGENINSVEGSEEIVGLTADGSKMVVYMEDITGNGDLYLSFKNGGAFMEPAALPKVVNSKYIEIAASISNDGRSIYFASNKPGGYGGTDLYVSRLLPNGKWGPAQNLGPTINTKYDEDFPNISPDGNVLFFSSKGHSGMGGYDIFRATWDRKKSKFNTVENMRFPINTPDDDLNFRISETGRYGYMSSLRADGSGDLDIYRVQFNEVEPQYTLISGFVKDSEGNEINADEVYLAVIDLEKDEVYGDYKPNRDNGRYVMILPPGKYEITLEVDGYEMYFEEIEILDKSSFKSTIDKDLIVTKE